mgnify:CR=1 FL=1
MLDFSDWAVSAMERQTRKTKRMKCSFFLFAERERSKEKRADAVHPGLVYDELSYQMGRLCRKKKFSLLSWYYILLIVLELLEKFYEILFVCTHFIDHVWRVG